VIALVETKANRGDAIVLLELSCARRSCASMGAVHSDVVQPCHCECTYAHSYVPGMPVHCGTCYSIFPGWILPGHRISRNALDTAYY
jgi:hypothetical protein